MVRPKESQAFDSEGEIAMIIGSNGRRISQSEALSHVAGFAFIMTEVFEIIRDTLVNLLQAKTLLIRELLVLG